MTDATVLEIASHFFTPAPPVASAPIAHGHIHETYVVTCGSARIVLQRLNRSVFRDLDALASNLDCITTHLTSVADARGARPVVAQPIATRSGDPMYIDERGAAWRASRFAEGTRVLGRDSTTNELRGAARAFAELTRDLDDLPPGALAETIPRFHDLPRRRKDLAAAIAADRVDRAGGVVELIERAGTLGDRLDEELERVGASELPPRIVHNDAKLDNVLVDSTTGAVACIVDLDTVMCGTLLNDFGELSRTAASRAAEDEPDVTRIELDRDRFAALADGYLTGAIAYLSESERACLPLAGPLLALENAVRFLTDHVEGDVYFRIHHRGHNAQRARAQLELAAQMLRQLDVLRDVIMATSS